MSITDELREWAVNHRAELNAGQLYPAMIEAIADRIDKEHERALADAELCAAPTEAQLSELGWVKLPVDADGVPIRVGDELEHLGEVITMELERFGTWQLGCSNGSGNFDADELRHVKHDSWERIIADAANYALDTQHTAGRISLKPFVERCKRLAGEGA